MTQETPLGILSSGQPGRPLTAASEVSLEKMWRYQFQPWLKVEAVLGPWCKGLQKASQTSHSTSHSCTTWSTLACSDSRRRIWLPCKITDSYLQLKFQAHIEEWSQLRLQLVLLAWPTQLNVPCICLQEVFHQHDFLDFLPRDPVWLDLLQ